MNVEQINEAIFLLSCDDLHEVAKRVEQSKSNAREEAKYRRAKYGEALVAEAIATGILEALKNQDLEISLPVTCRAVIWSEGNEVDVKTSGAGKNAQILAVFDRYNEAKAQLRKLAAHYKIRFEDATDLVANAMKR